MSGRESISWQQANFNFLMAAIASIRQQINRYIAFLEDKRWDEQQLEATFAQLNEAKEQMPSASALEHLYQTFNLEPFEIDLLLLCVAMELDPTFAQLCADAQKDNNLNYPTFSLALAVLPEANWEAISSTGSLRYWHLIEVQPGPTLLTSPLTLDENIFLYLMGLSFIDRRLGEIMKPLPTEERFAPSHRHLAQQLAATWIEGQEQKQYPLLQLSGDNLAAKQAIAAKTAEKLDLRLARLSVSTLPSNPERLDLIVRLWDREAILLGKGLLIECDRLTEDSDTSQTEALSYFLENSASFLILSSRERGLLTERPMITFDVEKPTQNEQEQLWKMLFSEIDLDLTGLANEIVFQFNMNYPNIYATWTETLGKLSQTETETFTVKEVAQILWDTCRLQARQKLDDLVQRIEPKAGWGDLVLPETQKQILEEIALEVRQRAKVYQDWGFNQKSERGLGISALFAGSSGTGKTLAAEILAKELCLDLYRIDLSTVINKYIGETEKNLRRVFDAAEAGGAILLFDEADALFGKRTETKDSHDRYANIEVSYLLQKMEAYRGLAILTTNIPEALDRAFKRRLRFIVQFPFPDFAQRVEIWQKMFPPQMPQADLDIQKLAQLNVSGGEIRNIALKAAFLASEKGRAVTMNDLLQAARSEYRKLEKTLTSDEIKDWLS